MTIDLVKPINHDTYVTDERAEWLRLGWTDVELDALTLVRDQAQPDYVAARPGSSREQRVLRAIDMILGEAGLAGDDYDAWARGEEPPRLRYNVEVPEGRTLVKLPVGYGDLTDRPKLVARLRERVGDAAQVETIVACRDGSRHAAIVVVFGEPSWRPLSRTLAIPEDRRDSDAAAIDALLRERGETLLAWDYSGGRQLIGRLAPWDLALRDRIAEHMRCFPWDLRVSTRWIVGKAGTGEPAIINVHRSPVIPVAERRRETWRELAEALIPSPAGTNWWVDDEPAVGRLTLRRAEDPLGQVLDYPWDVYPTYTSIPFGVDAAGESIVLGLLEMNALLGGVPGGGKSGGMTALLAGISRLEHVALVGLDPKVVEMAPWAARFSRIASDGQDVITVLDTIITEMEIRYQDLATTGRKKVTPEMLTDDLPLIVVVIDELADLVSIGVTPEERQDDQARSTMIRRLIAKGRAAGVVVIAATQKPQADVVPTALRDLIQQRVAYATTNSAMTDTILGAGMSMQGGLAHEIPAALRGVCYTVNETERAPRRGRTYWVPDELVAGVAESVAHLRVDLPWMPPPPPTVRRTHQHQAPAEPEVVSLGTLTFSLDDLEDEPMIISDEAGLVTEAGPPSESPVDGWAD